ncbi:MAG: hypothetical protein JO103_08295 [Candidatus Eremiobacteraeota bacterium]|nr:hypothetical protein [Candidatus Eremiobacteraeota bacterium]MBV9407973.1 hypothetical protein [Candidatus Eremiobacteraeota bacterium]
MTRAELLAGVLAASAVPRPIASATPHGVWADVMLEREGTALLAPFTVVIVLHNATGRIVHLRFPTADLFRIDVLHDDAPVWSSVTGHKPIPITRQLDVPPGLLRLAQVIVDSTTDDHHALAPGRYTVRVAMLGTNFGMVVDKPIAFETPATISDALAAKPGTVLTIAGVPYVDGGTPRLRDATGTLRLSRALGLRSDRSFVVRGFLDASGDERVFDVGRAAPAFEPSTSPTP